MYYKRVSLSESQKYSIYKALMYEVNYNDRTSYVSN